MTSGAFSFHLQLSPKKQLPEMKLIITTANVKCLFINLLLPELFFLILTHPVYKMSVLVGPCHHGMARPQVADRGTASDKEGSCE